VRRKEKERQTERTIIYQLSLVCSRHYIRDFSLWANKGKRRQDCLKDEVGKQEKIGC